MSDKKKPTSLDERIAARLAARREAAAASGGSGSARSGVSDAVAGIFLLSPLSFFPFLFTSFFAAETLATPWPVRRNFFILDNCATCSRRAWYVCRALAASHLLRAVCLLTTDVVLFCYILNILKCLFTSRLRPLTYDAW